MPPRPPILSSGRLKLRLPLKKLTVSKPLRGYEPAGAPGAMPTGVAPSVAAVCAFATRLSNKIVDTTWKHRAIQVLMGELIKSPFILSSLGIVIRVESNFRADD